MKLVQIGTGSESFRYPYRFETRIVRLGEGQPMRVVTIDGPGGAGKSTVAHRLAQRLGWKLLDTGAMYRAITLAALREAIDLNSEQAFAELVDRYTVRLREGRVLLNSEDVTPLLRTVDVTRASRFAADSPSVRRTLVAWQQAFAQEERDIITEGRDQGTIVFPDAFRKFFLSASDQERARRRHAEFVAKGDTIAFEEVLQDLQDRDARDQARAIAPLRPAPDAIIIDSTGLTLDQVVARIESEILNDEQAQA